MTDTGTPAARDSQETRRRVAVYVVIAGITGLAVLASGLLFQIHASPVVDPIPIAALIVMYAVAELALVHVAVRKETHSFSLADVPLVIGAFAAGPLAVIAARVVGSGAVLVARRHSPVKLAFNLAAFALSTAIGLLVFTVLVDPSDPVGPRAWVAAYATAIAADLVAAFCVELVIAASTGEPMRFRVRSTAALGFTMLNATLGIAAIVDWTMHPEGLWMPALMGIGLYAGYRLWMHERQRQDRLETLQGASHDIQVALGSDSLEGSIAREVRRTFGAATVDLLLPEPSSDRMRLIRASGEDLVTERAVATSALSTRWRDVLAGDRGIRATVPRRELEIDPAVPTGTHSVLAAPVPIGDGATGLVALIDREAKVGAWPADELALLETLATQIAVTLRNAQLIERVEARARENEYLARHDTLTGLPNRDWLRQLIDEALADPSKAPAGVLVVYLSGFKELVETLGHDNADAVLRAVAKRLAAATAPGWLVGRLDGHELAVVVPGPAPVERLRDVADDLIARLHEPFAVDDLRLGLSSRIGLVAVRDDGADARTLLRRAEGAVTHAIGHDLEIGEYDVARDINSPVRMALVGELRRALEERELTVLFQPKLSLATDRIVGGEALVRWMHPTRGMVPPDEFIPVAEHSNVLRPMTLFVLDMALARCEAWRQTGTGQSVAVNLSVRNLLDHRIVDDVQRLVSRSGVPPEALTLEITESAAMLDPGRAREVMVELRALGVHLAIDDFGAGYASLAYLKQLPANELKVDKTFVQHIETDPRDRAIVRSSIDLAHDLGFKVVAEGVETAAAMDLLRELGADLVQGWHIGRPMTAEAFDVALAGSLASAVRRR